jgi:hypothetical protein
MIVAAYARIRSVTRLRFLPTEPTGNLRPTILPFPNGLAILRLTKCGSLLQSTKPYKGGPSFL